MEKQSLAGSAQGWDRGALSVDVGFTPMEPNHLRGTDAEVQQVLQVWQVNGDIDIGGPWAGVKELLSDPVTAALTCRPELVLRHSYELAYVLPELREKLNIRNLSLTELAPREEKVRNYPADRAHRVVHGLIDFLVDLGLVPEPWNITILNAHRLGAIGRLFFKELLRRRGDALDLRLILLAPEDYFTEVRNEFPEQVRHRVEIRKMKEDLLTSASTPEESRQKALALELVVDQDPLAIEIRLPELINLWKETGSHELNVFNWLLWGLDIYNNLGLYHDARHYGEPALEISRRLDLPFGTRWALFTKLFMSRVGTQDSEMALELAQGWTFETIENDLRRAQYCYLMAMLYVRHLPSRDLTKAEEYLDLGLEFLHAAGLPKEDYHFHVVFNRNGLALIRHFQGRAEEAIDLCRDGFKQLQMNLNEDKHKLHRSVLLYNQAQVYAGLGMTDLALSHFDGAIEMDPNFSEYHNERASVLLKTGHLEDALAGYLRAIELSPPYPEVFANLGQCYRLLGRSEEALHALSISLDLDPGQAFSYLNRGELREMAGDINGALEDFSQAITLRPQHWLAYARRAPLRYGTGDLVGAEDDLASSLALGGPPEELCFNHGIVLCDLGRNHEARDAFTRYLKLNPAAEDRDDVMARLSVLDREESLR